MPYPPQLLPKSVIFRTTIGDATSPTPIRTTNSPKSLRRNFSFLALLAVSFPVFAAMVSLLLSSYLHRISRKENSACSACGHPLQDLNHLLLDCPASEPLRKSIFGSSLSLFLIYGPDLGVWPNCWVSTKFLRAPIPQKGSGSTTTTSGVGRVKIIYSLRFFNSISTLPAASLHSLYLALARC